MRTTLDLPDDLLKRAKIAAIERGTTLRELFGSALRREIEQPAKPVARKRVQFPILKSKNPNGPKVGLDVPKRLEAEEDARRHGFSS